MKGIWVRSDSYNWSPIDSNNEVKPRLNCKLQVCVSQHLEAKGTLLVLLLRSVAVQAGHESV